MKNKYLYASLLIIIILFYFLNNAIWLKKDFKPEGNDSCWHIFSSVRYKIAHEKILQSDLSIFQKIKQLFLLFNKSWNRSTGWWPVLIFLLSTIFKLDDFFYYNIRLYLNILFFSLMIISTYFIGKKCFSKAAGLFSCIFLAFITQIYAYSRYFELDFFLAGIVPLCIAFLLYSESFSNRLYSILFALSLCFGTLIKLQILFFIFIPFLFSVWAVFNTTENKKNRLINFLIMSVLSLVILAIFWADKLKFMIGKFHSIGFCLYPFYKESVIAFSEGRAVIPIFSIEGLSFYFLHIFNMLTSPYLIFFLISLYFFLVKATRFRLYFLLTILFPIVLHTFFSFKYGRYMLPVLPILSIVPGWYIQSIKNRIFKITLTAIIMLYGVWLFYSASWIGIRQKPPLFLSSRIMHIENVLVPPCSFGPLRLMSNEDAQDFLKIFFSKQNKQTVNVVCFYSDGVLFFGYLEFSELILKNKINISYSTDIKEASKADYVLSTPANANKLLKNFKFIKNIGSIMIFEK